MVPTEIPHVLLVAPHLVDVVGVVVLLVEVAVQVVEEGRVLHFHGLWVVGFENGGQHIRDYLVDGLAGLSAHNGDLEFARVGHEMRWMEWNNKR